MGEQALEKINKKIDTILKQKKNKFRDEVDRLSHIYTVNSSAFANQLAYQLEHVEKYFVSTVEEKGKTKVQTTFRGQLKKCADLYTKALRTELKSKGAEFSTSSDKVYKATLNVGGRIKNPFAAFQSARKQPLTELKDNIVKLLFDDFTSSSEYRDYLKMSDEELVQIDNEIRRVSGTKVPRTLAPEGSSLERYARLSNDIFGYFKREKSTRDPVTGKKIRGKIVRENGEAVRVAGTSELGHAKHNAVSQRLVAKIANEYLDAHGIEEKLIQLGVKVNISSAFERTRASKSLIKLGAKVFGINVEVFDEARRSNQGSSAAEKKSLEDSANKIKGILLKELAKEDWVNQEGSSSYAKVARAAILSPLNNIKKGKNVKVSIPGEDLNIDLSSSRTSKVILNNKSSSKNIKKSSSSSSIPFDAKRKKTTRKSAATTARPAQNWSSLISLMNQKLPQQVAKNMGAPGLVYRTGRLADSARVVGIEATRGGSPSIVFDYQRDPYDVFDRTLGRSPWNTPARDPRTLVDKSVREIAQELAIGRFFTRRA